MTSRLGRRHDPFIVPTSVRWLGYASLAIAALICLTGAITFFLTAMALSGRETVKLKLPLIARAIQWTELAVTLVGLAFIDLHFLVSQGMTLKKMNRFYTPADVRFQRKCLTWCWFPNRLMSLGVWIVLVVFQSQYVPILGHETLSDCVGFWIDKKRCNAVNGSWVTAIIYCVLCAASLGVSLAFILRLRRCENELNDVAEAYHASSNGAAGAAYGGSSTRGPYVPLSTNDRP